MKKAEEDQKPSEDAVFQRVVSYFLGHSKPKDEGGARPPKHKPAVKATKGAPRKRRPVDSEG